MNKAINRANTVSLPQSTDGVSIDAEPSFSTGELGQLQEILFGQQQRSTNSQLQNLQASVNEQIETLGNMLNSRLNKLTESFESSGQDHQQYVNEFQLQHTAMQQQQQAQRKLLTSIEQSIADLANEKVNSAQLADVLKKMADHLSNDSRN